MLLVMILVQIIMIIVAFVCCQHRELVLLWAFLLLSVKVPAMQCCQIFLQKQISTSLPKIKYGNGKWKLEM